MSAKKRVSPKLSITIPPAILKEVVRIAKADGRTKSNAIAHLVSQGILLHDHNKATLKAAGAIQKTEAD